jgi:muramoyltetrapeptide carboxypeptidase
MEVRKPSRPLRSGDLIAMIRPGLSGDFPEWHTVLNRLEKMGLGVALAGEGTEGSTPFSGPYYAEDSIRARDIEAALRNPEYAAVMAFRGGSGAIRILDRWSRSFAFGGPVPVVCGFSDMTYLHALLARSENLVTFWGPNARELSDPDSFDLWWRVLSGGLKGGDLLPLGEARVLRPGRASGLLWGGNLESLAHLCGTPFLPDLAGRILLLEDVDEPLYAIDRALRTLYLSGILERVAGIVLGPFSRVDRRGDDPAETVFDLLAPLSGPGPVISSSLPGHSLPMATWPLNVPVALVAPDAGPPSLSLLDSPFGRS